MGESAIAAPEQPRLSFFARLAGIYFSPGETFANISRYPDFIVPLVVMIVLGVAATEAFLQKIGLEPVVRWALEHSARTASLPPDQMEQTVARVVGFQAILARVGTVIWAPLLAVIVAGIGLLVIKTIFGQDLKFKTAFSIAAYAYLVNIVYVVMVIVLILVGDPEHAISNPQNLSPSSLGFFLNPVDASKPLLALGGSLEVFTIWYMVLLGVGFSQATSRKVKPVPVFLIFFALWLVVTLAKMGLATLG